MITDLDPSSVAGLQQIASLGTDPASVMLASAQSQQPPALGMQQNNPLNLRYAGQPGATPGRNGFAQFPTMPDGVAANIRQLLINQDQHGIHTVRGQVQRWVSDPNADLNTYIGDISNRLHVGPDDPIDVHNPMVQAAFVEAAQPHESGPTTLSPDDVQKGVQIASAGNVQSDVVPDPAGTAGQPAANPNVIQQYMGLFASPDKAFAPMQDTLNNYLAQQPQMWAQLQNMRDDYLNSAKITPSENLQDAAYQAALGLTSTAGLRHATAGGVLTHSLPDVSAPMQGLQAQRQADLQERQMRLGAAKAAFDTGSTILQGQQAQAAKNTELQNSLETAKMNYALQTGAMALKGLQFSNDQIKILTSYAGTLSDNPNAIAAIWQDFAAHGGNPAASLTASYQQLDESARRVAATGIPLKATNKQIDITGKDASGVPVHNVVSNDTAEGQDALHHIPPGYEPHDLGATQVTNNNTSSAGGREGGAKATPGQGYAAAAQGIQSADAAIKLLSAVGSGPVKNSMIGQQFYGLAGQLGFADPKTVSQMQLLGKLINKMQLASALQSLSGVARIGVNEVQTALQGEAGPKFLSGALLPWLQHYKENAIWEQGRIERNVADSYKGISEDQSTINYIKEVGPPPWDLSGLLSDQAPSQQGGSQPQQGGTQRQPTNPGSYRYDPNTHSLVPVQ